MVMDVIISPLQAAHLLDVALSSQAGYVDINPPYHYSWHRNSLQVVVGIGRGQGYHHNFNCSISSFLGITVTATGGGLALGGSDGINVARLTASITNAIKLTFRKLVREQYFNSLDRTPQRLTFNHARIINRARHTDIIVNLDGQPNSITVSPQESRMFVNGDIRGIALFRNFPHLDCYYRNIDINEEFVLSREPLIFVPTVGHIPYKLTSPISGNIRTTTIGE